MEATLKFLMSVELCKEAFCGLEVPIKVARNGMRRHTALHEPRPVAIFIHEEEESDRSRMAQSTLQETIPGVSTGNTVAITTKCTFT
jgi:hypothetical protein